MDKRRQGFIAGAEVAWQRDEVRPFRFRKECDRASHQNSTAGRLILTGPVSVGWRCQCGLACSCSLYALSSTPPIARKVMRTSSAVLHLPRKPERLTDVRSLYHRTPRICRQTLTTEIRPPLPLPFLFSLHSSFLAPFLPLRTRLYSRHATHHRIRPDPRVGEQR